MPVHNPRELEPAQCAGLIKHAQALVVLTGAGISTAAGIPDFRGPRGIDTFHGDTTRKKSSISTGFSAILSLFYEFSRDFIELMMRSGPTFSHRFLASLEQQGHLKGVITQNIDALTPGGRLVKGY